MHWTAWHQFWFLGVLLYTQSIFAEVEHNQQLRQLLLSDRTLVLEITNRNLYTTGQYAK